MFSQPCLGNPPYRRTDTFGGHLGNEIRKQPPRFVYLFSIFSFFIISLAEIKISFSKERDLLKERPVPSQQNRPARKQTVTI